MRSIYFKELSIYFSSPLFYVLAGMFACIAGLYFFHSIASTSLLATKILEHQSSTGLSMDDLLIRPIFSDFSLLVILFAPLISMRLYAEERAEGTIELLLTYPVSDLSVLLGKYLASLTVLAAMLLTTGFLMWLITWVIHPNWRLVASSYMGLFLLGATILSIGVFASSLTKNQIIAAGLTTGTVLVFWTIGWFENLFPRTYIGRVFTESSFVNHLSHFYNGTISLTDILFFVEISLFFIILTLEVIGYNRWKR